jgi:carboxyl-terminal processing protease
LSLCANTPLPPALVRSPHPEAAGSPRYARSRLYTLPMPSGRKRSRFVPLVLCTVAAFAGGVVASGPLLAGRFDPYRKLSVFTKVLSYIENNYVENIAEGDLMLGAARGLTDALDPHSRFMDPEEYDRLKRETEGDTEITGIGIDVEKHKRGLVVVSPIEGSPAWRAGVEPGDLIRRIDGTDADTLEWEDAVSRIQGAAGSEVSLVVDRRGKELSFRIRRERFEVRTVEGRVLDDGYGYAKIRIFSSNTDTKLLEVLEDLKKKTESAGGLRGLVLDLRRNPGGLLDQGVRVADRFLSEGMIVRTVGKGGREMDRQLAHARGTWSGFPMVVLVDQATASAAEIVAGALQDHQRAVIMGTRSFGKGSVQTVMEIDGCGPKPCGLKLTVSRYYTPSGRSIQNHGIIPDVLVDSLPPAEGEAEDFPREKNYPRHLRDEKTATTTTTRKRLPDHQLQVALEYLRSWAVFQKQAGKKG